LRWLGQEQARQVEAVVLKDELLRLVDIPLVIKLAGMPQVARGTQVTLDILRWDEIDLSVEARLLEIEAAPGAVLTKSDVEPAADEAAEEGASVNLPEDAEEELAELASPTVISEPAVE
jgi:exoribonuclease-2